MFADECMMQNRLSSYGVLFVILCRTDLSADTRRNGILLTASDTSDVRDGNIRHSGNTYTCTNNQAR